MPSSSFFLRGIIKNECLARWKSEFRAPISTSLSHRHPSHRSSSPSAIALSPGTEVYRAVLASRITPMDALRDEINRDVMLIARHSLMIPRCFDRLECAFWRSVSEVVQLVPRYGFCSTIMVFQETSRGAGIDSSRNRNFCLEVKETVGTLFLNQIPSFQGKRPVPFQSLSSRDRNHLSDQIFCFFLLL